MFVTLYWMVKVVAFGWMLNTMFLVFTVVDAGEREEEREEEFSQQLPIELLIERKLIRVD